MSVVVCLVLRPLYALRACVRCSFARALEFYDISEASVRTGWAVLSLFQPRSVS